MFKYGSLQGDEELPCPQVEIEVRSHGTSARVPLEVLVDTGAGMTCLPGEIFDQLRIEDYGVARVKGALGEPEWRRTAVVSIRFGVDEIPDTEVLFLDRDYGLLGRDILNGYRVVLDASKDFWSVEDA